MKPGKEQTLGVVIAAYNAEAYLERAVSSVLRQTHDDWELVIVDDGSDDRTYELAREYAAADARISALSISNSGAAIARNEGSKKLVSDWFCFLDADDELASDYVQQMSDFRDQNPGFQIYGCDGMRMQQDGSSELVFTYEDFFEVPLIRQIQTNTIIGGGGLIEKASFDRVGCFRDVLAEDYDLWVRMLAAGCRAKVTPYIGYRYYKVKGQKSERVAANAQSVIGSLNFVQKNYDLPDEEKSALKASRRSLKTGILFLRIERVLRLFLGAKKSGKAIEAIKSFARSSKKVVRGGS